MAIFYAGNNCDDGTTQRMDLCEGLVSKENNYSNFLFYTFMSWFPFSYTASKILDCSYSCLGFDQMYSNKETWFAAWWILYL